MERLTLQPTLQTDLDCQAKLTRLHINGKPTRWPSVFYSPHQKTSWGNGFPKECPKMGIDKTQLKVCGWLKRCDRQDAKVLLSSHVWIDLPKFFPQLSIHTESVVRIFHLVLSISFHSLSITATGNKTVSSKETWNCLQAGSLRAQPSMCCLWGAPSHRGFWHKRIQRPYKQHAALQQLFSSLLAPVHQKNP